MAEIQVESTAQLMLSILGPTGPAGPGGGFPSVADVLILKAPGDPDYTNALIKAIATGLPIMFQYNGGVPYTISAQQSLPSNTTVFSFGGRASISMAATAALFLINGTSNIRIRDLIINGNKGSVISAPIMDFENASDCVVENVDFINPPTEFRIAAGSTNVRIINCVFTNSGFHGIHIDGANTQKNVVTRCLFNNSTQFSMVLSAGAHENELSFNKTYQSGLELIGITYQCWGNRVIGNHAEGTGDNGISVTGFDNVVVGNICRMNAHSGITLYGRGNVATGNHCRNNGQQFLIDGSNWAGIMINPSFGGSGYHNTVTGNVCSDDQAVPTQAWGTCINFANYASWATGVVTTLGSDVQNGGNVYVAASAGTTGANPPVHTAGTVSDGGVSWTFLFGILAPNIQLGSADNSVSGNTCFGNRIANAIDQSGNSNTDVGGVASSIHCVNNTPPNGVFPGVGGDFITRKGVGQPYIAAYVNFGASLLSTTKWVPVQVRFSGVHIARPLLGPGFEGSQWWDTDQTRITFNTGSFLGAVWVDAMGRQDAADALTAAGVDVGTALPLLFQHSRFTNVGNGTGALLPNIPYPGAEMVVRNDGANALTVYQASGATFTIAAGAAQRFTAFNTTTWF